uniref:Phospholipase A2-like domain-containing protein n=1 Tax=Schizaphis graminum TaxID=13262 RepID=A0A2S2NK18_SCHGA
MVLKFIPVIFLIWFTFNCHGQTESRETHFPGYHFCGPGTDFLERIARGQLGINKLDEACRLHDSVYTSSTDFKLRMEADMKLETQAWERVIAKDSSYKEKIAAWMVTNVMKVKRKWNTRRLQREFGKKPSELLTPTPKKPRRSIGETPKNWFMLRFG